jgi:RNA polymerase sigma factor (sigma-70 family)
MHDARDAEDRRLLETREYKQLLAGYFHPVLERCFVRLRSEEAANEVAQMVFVRLLRELRGGKPYTVPFRVVVWKVTEWTLKGYFPSPKPDAALPDSWDTEAPDAYLEWEDKHDFDLLIADLPPRQREVLELAYREELSPAKIATRLGIKRNAVDQAMHNGHRRLAETLHG